MLGAEWRKLINLNTINQIKVHWFLVKIQSSHISDDAQLQTYPLIILSDVIRVRGGLETQEWQEAGMMIDLLRLCQTTKKDLETGEATTKEWWF